MARQRDIEDNNVNWPPVLFFAEGTTSNTTQLMTFRRGAFEAMRAIMPCFVKTSYCHISTSYDVVGALDLFMLLFSSLQVNVTTHSIMPVFVPNKYMLEKHADKGSSDWEIYAWCVREAMCKAGNFGRCEQTFKDKIQYENFMLSQSETCTYNEKTWTAADFEQKEELRERTKVET
jgi:hypothetical protein